MNEAVIKGDEHAIPGDGLFGQIRHRTDEGEKAVAVALRNRIRRKTSKGACEGDNSQKYFNGRPHWRGKDRNSETFGTARGCTFR